MSLPIVLLENEEKWDCHQCGFCCRGSLIPLSNLDAERLQKQKWNEQPEYQRLRIVTGDRAAESGFRLAHRADGSCVFLNEDGLCRIHSKFGIEAKPTICQTFPLQLISHEHQAVLTIRRACPSAAADLGRGVSNQLAFIKGLVRDDRLEAQSKSPPLLKIGEARDWRTMRSVLESVGDLLQDVRYPPVRRLVHALQFASLLQAAKTKRLSDAQIVELARTLAELVPEESKPFFDDLQAPKAYSKILFRIAAIYFARLHPEAGHKSNWAARFQLMNTAWTVMRGTGPTPTIDKIFPVATLEALDKPLGVMRPEIYVPLARFMETNSASFMYAISDRQSWSVVDSIRGLALRFPVALWMLRWLAQDRQPTVQDVVQVVVALDRSQGFAPLCGTNHRWRLSMLGANGELERLVVWYAR